MKYQDDRFAINTSGTVEEVEPPKPAHQLDPVDYVRHIHNLNPGNGGRPVDISKARNCSRADLLATNPRDIELILQYGVSQPQLAKIYNVPLGSMGKIFKDLGVNTGVEMLVNEKFSPDGSPTWKKKAKTKDLPDEPEPRDVVTDPAKIAELMSEPDPVTPPEIYQGFTWFYGAPKPGTIPILTVMDCGKVSFPIAISKQYIDTRIMVGFKGNPDNLIVAKTDNPGIGLKPSLKQAKIRCDELAEALVKGGIELPARYKMSYNEPEQLWSGVLMP